MTKLYSLILLLLGLGLASTCVAQNSNLTCNATSVPPIVRAEGITERIGDIVVNCSGGAPGAKITGNFGVFLPVNVTNRIAGTTISGVNFTVDSGSGPQAVTTPGTLAGPGNIVYNGLTFTLSSTGTATLRIAGIRVAASQLMLLPNTAIQASLTFNSGTLISLTSSTLIVGQIARGLYTGSSTALICAPTGSTLPSTVGFASFINSGVIFSSTRMTEGFADAFGSRNAPANLNADTGTRFIIRYAGLPAGATIYVPNVVAGSDAIQPTGGGDFGVPPSGGVYAPGGNGSLLLALVQGAGSTGAGGSPVYAPGAPGSGPVTFDTLSQVPLSSGSGYAVYEVVDSDNSTLETAQFPTFLGLAPQSVSTPVTTSSTVTFAPVSTVQTATATDPIPRFIAVAPQNDCSIIGDCSANYFPRLFVDTTAISLTAQAGSPYQVAYRIVNNQGGGIMQWSATVNYQNGSGWLSVSPDAGLNNATIRVDTTPGNLAPGTYRANIVVDTGSVSGQKTIPVTLTITAAPPPPAPVPSVSKVVNAASFADGPVAPGSLATIQGSKFAGKTLAVTFDGIAAKILFANDNQINLLVPAELGGKSSSQVMVTVDGNASPAQTVKLVSMAPAIFSAGVLNQEYSVNSANNPAAPGSIIQIFATGLSGPGPITARINDRNIDAPYYAGVAPGLIGVQQVDLVLPADLSASTASVSVCGSIPGVDVCSPAANVAIGQ
jgi:uncharacterized protein (TIGR03437 family)